MSNYTLAVSWSDKDALSDSNVAKVISGVDFNTEFTTVQTAINSKADVNGDSGEAFSTSTAESTTNGTTIAASTEYVERALVAHTPASDSNGYGTRYVQSADPAATAASGDVWYEI